MRSKRVSDQRRDMYCVVEFGEVTDFIGAKRILFVCICFIYLFIYLFMFYFCLVIIRVSL